MCFRGTKHPGLGGFPRALVCGGGRQLLGLSAAATLVQLSPYGAVSLLPPTVWAVLECAGREQWSKGRFRAAVLWLNKSRRVLLATISLLSRHELFWVCM